MMRRLALPAAWTAFLLLVAVYAVHAVVPANPLALPGENRQVARALLPQGWGFFTRSAQEADPRVMKLADGRWLPLSFPPPSHLGVKAFDRGTRAQGVEVGLLFGAITARKVEPIKCTVAPEVCLQRTSSSQVTLANTALRPTVCGQVAVILQSPVPWAYREHRETTNAPSRLWRLEVSC